MWSNFNPNKSKHVYLKAAPVNIFRSEREKKRCYVFVKTNPTEVYQEHSGARACN